MGGGGTDPTLRNGSVEFCFDGDRREPLGDPAGARADGPLEDSVSLLLLSRFR